MMQFSFLDQRLHLLAGRALYWEEKKTLVVADLHLGKAATFRAHGLALPSGTTHATLMRLSALLERTQAERLLILGDLLHARAGRTAALIDQVAAWRQEYGALRVDLVLGNHDRGAGVPPHTWAMDWGNELAEAPFVWRHEPGSSDRGYVVAGHVHPGVHLRGPGERLTLPCFYFGQKYGILPAFGEFTGWGIVRAKAGDAVFVIAEDEVIRVSA
jgi:DNA ligase-associated metallophosphoesterase